MDINREARAAHGVRFSIIRDGREIARASLYITTNDLHQAPFGLLEDVYVDEAHRGSGLGTSLVQEAVGAAHEAGCYKPIATSRTSRPEVHKLYRRLGFTDHGIEFRMKLSGT